MILAAASISKPLCGAEARSSVQEPESGEHAPIHFAQTLIPKDTSGGLDSCMSRGMSKYDTLLNS